MNFSIEEKIEQTESELSSRILPGSNTKLIEYIHGRCHIFAQALHSMTGWPMQFLFDEEAWFNDGEFSGKALVHAYIIHPNGKKFDMRGFVSDQEIEASYEVNEPSIELISMENLEEMYRDNFLERPTEEEINLLQKYIVAVDKF